MKKIIGGIFQQVKLKLFELTLDEELGPRDPLRLPRPASSKQIQLPIAFCKRRKLSDIPTKSQPSGFRVSSKETCETPCLSRPLRVRFGNPESFKISNLPCPIPAFTGFYLGFSGFREPCCTRYQGRI